MPTRLTISIAQIDTLVGDVQGNARKVIHYAQRAREAGADVVLFPELTLTGYPPEDLLLRPGFVDAATQALDAVQAEVRGIHVVVGGVVRDGAALYNAAVVLHDGARLAVYYKQQLPNYGVFDEKRYFTAGAQACVVPIKGLPVGITICEDIWYPAPARLAAQAGARIILNLNASPFNIGKGCERESVVRARVDELGVPVVYANLVGGQDELVFDGASFALDARGGVAMRAPAFDEGLYPVELAWDRADAVVRVSGAQVAPVSEVEGVYRALVTGVRDYVTKNRFPGAVLGLSGGIDSALTLAIAVDALGAAAVEAVMMPSRYTASISLADAAQMAEILAVDYRVLPIEPVYQAFLGALRDEFAGRAPDVTEENIQARCRGTLLMAISNKKNKVVLTTGNKSEMAVGYATLYGDMAGGFDVLKDVPKTWVYRLCEYRNAIAPVIPQRIIDRPPSAELAPDQKDTDSLPPYDLLDAILALYVEHDRCPDEIVAAGYDRAVVERVAAMVDRSEYKRRQAPPGVRITQRAFGKDRRYPITSGYRRGHSKQP